MSFFGEFICLGMFFLQTRINQKALDAHAKRKEEAEEQGLSTEFSKLKVAVPAMCDFFSSTLQFAGLILISSSIYQMLKGGTIILTAIFSVLFLKRKLKSYHYIGIILTVMGVTIVGLSSFLISGEDDD
jgi:drug/metabolite transporter (DMT)-like permease